MKVPLLDLEAHHRPIQERLLKAVQDVVEKQAFIQGPQIQKLEQRVAAYGGAKFAVAVSSGTDALLVALMALDIGPGDEVVTSAYSFFATAGVVARLGAKPVFADIDPGTYNIDIHSLQRAVTPRTKAIIPVHLFGQCAEMDAVLSLARERHIRVVEDAAQAIGAQYKDGRRAGCMGDMGCFSFYPSKNLGAWGDGGMVVTSDEALAEKLRILRVHGSKPKYYHKLVGGNFRLDTIQAAVLDVKLDYLEDWTRRRQANAQRYRDLLSRAGLEKWLVLPAEQYRSSGVSCFHIYNQFVVRTPRRDSLRRYLNEHGIGTDIYYPVPFHLQECFRPLGYKQGDFPESEKAALETLALPIYPELTPEMQQYVAETMSEFFRSCAVTA